MTRAQALAIVLVLAGGAFAAAQLVGLPDAGKREHGEHGEDDGHGGQGPHGVLSDEALAAAGVRVAAAGPGTVRETVRLSGQVTAHEDHLAHVAPRFPGMIREARKRVGDRVERGETIAVVQSNDSMEPYPVPAPLTGAVVWRHATPGEYVAQGETIFRIADLGRVWAEMVVPRRDLPRVRLGQRVVLDGGEGVPPAEGGVAYVSPFALPETQSAVARVELQNPEGLWRPGLFVGGTVMLEPLDVPVAVEAGAVQRMNDRDVVFVRTGETFATREVVLGRSDGEWTEISSGLRPGELYAAANSFVVKAELGKAAAGHDH